jgi:hypothetical protein
VKIVHLVVAFMLATVPAYSQGLVAPPSSAFPRGLPDLCPSPTIQSVTNGSWSNPSTWSPARVPTSSDRVRVSAAVTYDATSRVQCVAVTGVLSVSRAVSTSIITPMLLVHPGGVLDWGSVSSPVPAAVKAEIVLADQPIDLAVDPEQYGGGLLVLGVYSSHGAFKTGYVALGGMASGQTVVTAKAAPVGWAPQDILTLPDTRQVEVPNPSRPVLMAAAGSGLTLTPSSAVRPVVVGESLHLGNLTRNVVVKSENPSGVRGHVLAANDAIVDVRYTEFVNLGRTRWDAWVDSAQFDSFGNLLRTGNNQIGRYGIHFHHLMRPGSKVIGCAFRDTLKWAVALHRTNFTTISDNVMVDSGGAAIMTEDGSEYGNVIVRNLIVGSPGTRSADSAGRSQKEFGFESSGGWLSGPMNTFSDNLIYNVLIGIVMYPHESSPVPTPEGPKLVNCTPIKELARNTVASSFYAMQLWDVGMRSADYNCEVGAESKVEDFHAWHIWKRGVYHYPSNRVHHIRPRFISDPGQSLVSANVGFDFGDYSQRNVKITGAYVYGFRTCVAVPNKMGDVRDMYGATATPMIITDPTFDCMTGIGAGTQWGVVGGGAWLVPRTVEVVNALFPRLMPGASNGLNLGISAATMAQAAQGSVTFNWIVKELFLVRNYNGTGEDFQLFQKEQAPGFITPNSFGRHIGAPLPGFTNQYNLATYKVALGGELARCSNERPNIYGFVCPLDGSTPPPPETEPPPPSPPPPSPIPGQTVVEGPLKLASSDIAGPGASYTVTATVDISSGNVHVVKFDDIPWTSQWAVCPGFTLCRTFTRTYTYSGPRQHKLEAVKVGGVWAPAIITIN